MAGGVKSHTIQVIAETRMTMARETRLANSQKAEDSSPMTGGLVSDHAASPAADPEPLIS